jgi:DNA repair protein RadC
MRPREELTRRGPASVSDEVLLAVALRSGTRGQNVIDLARSLLSAMGSLGAVARASVDEIVALGLRGLGRVKAMELVAAFELGRRAANLGPVTDPVCLRDPEGVWRVVEPRVRSARQEVFWVLMLNTRNRLIGQPLPVTTGLLDASAIDPREVLSPALCHRAAAVIVAHNHPSGDPAPSAEDLRITRQLIAAARVVGIRLLDHVVIGRAADNAPGYVSLREQGLVSFDAA